MPKQIRVIQNWTNLRLVEIDSFAFNVVNQMTDNKFFKNPTVGLDVMSGAATNYTTAYGNRLNGATTRSIFKTAKTELFGLLKQQGEYV